jgi:hypothetical protein
VGLVNYVGCFFKQLGDSLVFYEYMMASVAAVVSS